MAIPSRPALAALLFLVSCGEAPAGDDTQGGDDAPPVVPAAEELRIGSIDDPDYTLTWMSGLVVGPGGRIFSLHPNEQVLRVFAPDGTLEQVLGGEGEGPGEFRRPYAMGSIGDTLWVLDNGTSRFTRFTWNGDLIDSFRAPMPTVDAESGERRIYPDALLPGGRVYGRALADATLVATGEITHGTHVIMDLGGTTADTVLHVPLGRNQWEIRDPADERGPRMYTRQPFGDGRLTALPADGDGLWIVDRSVGRGRSGSSYEVFRITFAGDTVVRRAFDPALPPVSEEEIDSAFDVWAEVLGNGPLGTGVGVPELRSWIERDFYHPAARPGVTHVVAGRDGTLWLQESWAWSDSTTTWRVLDAKGVPRRRVTLPADLRVLVAEEGTVWGSRTDDLDVPYIVRYRVEEAAATGDG